MEKNYDDIINYILSRLDGGGSSEISAENVTYGSTNVKAQLDSNATSISEINTSLDKTPRFVSERILVSSATVPSAGQVDYTATEDCIVCAMLLSYNNEASYLYVINNGVARLVGMCQCTGAFYVRNTVTVYLKKGQTARITSPNHSSSLYSVYALI